MSPSAVVAVDLKLASRAMRAKAGLAATVGESVRQLQRLLVVEVGAAPLALARAQRAQTARTLIETSSLPMAEVALAAGFAGSRQLGKTIRSAFAMTPTQLRRRSREGGGPANGVIGRPWPSAGSLQLRLAFRRPLRPENLFGHLAATAIPGVEEVRDATYRRTLRLPNGPGIVELTPHPDHISCRLWLGDFRDLTTAVARCRWLLDLDADPEGIDQELADDPILRPLIARAPGRRVPRAVDGAEMAIRAVLGRARCTRSSPS